MRRKRPVMTVQLASAGLLMDSAPPLPVDDPAAPYEQRRGVFAAWHDEYGEWCARREEWSELHGWPAGDQARIDEETALIDACPDSPFDPAWEIAHGYL